MKLNLLIAAAIIVNVTLALFASRSVALSRSQLVRSEELRADLERMDRVHARMILKLESDMDRATAELTDSVVQLRKLNELAFFWSDDSIMLVVTKNDEPVTDVKRLCVDLNGVVEFQAEQRKRVHWNLEDPDPDLQPMTEKEFEEFQAQLKEYIRQRDAQKNETSPESSLNPNGSGDAGGRNGE